MGNLDAAYTVDHWMRDFMHKLMGLSHETLLARNLTEHHKTKGMIAIKAKEELLKEADKIAQQCSLNIEKKYSWLIDVESAAYAEMGHTEVQCLIFELTALHAQEKLIAKRTGGKTTNWTEYSKMCGGEVPVDNYIKGDGSLLAEKEEEEEAAEEEAKREQKKAKASAKPEAVPVPMKPATKVTVAGTRVKRCRKVAR